MNLPYVYNYTTESLPGRFLCICLLFFCHFQLRLFLKVLNVSIQINLILCRQKYVSLTFLQPPPGQCPLDWTVTKQQTFARFCCWMESFCLCWEIWERCPVRYLVRVLLWLPGVGMLPRWNTRLSSRLSRIFSISRSLEASSCSARSRSCRASASTCNTSSVPAQ